VTIALYIRFQKRRPITERSSKKSYLKLIMVVDRPSSSTYVNAKFLGMVDAVYGDAFPHFNKDLEFLGSIPHPRTEDEMQIHCRLSFVLYRFACEL
jgi:hypothetical protein